MNQDNFHDAAQDFDEYLDAAVETARERGAPMNEVELLLKEKYQEIHDSGL